MAEVGVHSGIVSTFPIVGIGASAGGLAAFNDFFSGLSAVADLGMAFVLVQHLAPDHKSVLTELIRKQTRLNVFEVIDGISVEVNCVYVIPPNYDMVYFNRKLHLLAPQQAHGHRLPIDTFFCSLAESLQDRSIGIILSGTGKDGSLGAQAIRQAGGIVMVQAPNTAEYDGMPRSALEIGAVDYELPPSDMPAQLADYLFNDSEKSPHQTIRATPLPETILSKIYFLLRTQTGHDFSQHKPNTISRRIERRMDLQQIHSIEEYVLYLQQTPVEIEALFRELLIGVTSFFRDPMAFLQIKEQVIPLLFVGKSKRILANEAVRIWVCGCSTGEEAYSIAMLIQEYRQAIGSECAVQIFATDIDHQAIKVARAGIYPASIAAAVSPERLSLFFTREDDELSYRINKSLREMMIFSEQDVIKDPPFSKIDLICCRNLMIYFGSELQKKIIRLFHFSLNPNGFLFLGASEGIGHFTDGFVVLDRKSKIFRKNAGVSHIPRIVKTQSPATGFVAQSAPFRSIDPSMTSPKLPLRELTEQALLKQISPPSALVNSQGDILYLHGRVGQYLELSSGESGVNNILKMAREGLRSELTITLHKVVAAQQMLKVRGLLVKSNSHFTRIDITVVPVKSGTAADSVIFLYLVIFEEATARNDIESSLLTHQAADADTDVQDSERIAALTKELQSRDEFLQSTSEELESSIEELKSSNEEMQSMNEELQSTNEELETSKEEMQSINEELATVNAELNAKVAELSRLNNDMMNLLSGSGIATIFVDHKLHILRFTPTAAQLINLIQSDIGRPVGHLVSNLVEYHRLAADAKQVLDTLARFDAQVQSTEGKWFAMRMRPYRTVENVIEGVVITFQDVTSMKQLEEELKKANQRRRLSAPANEPRDAIEKDETAK